MRKMSEHGEHVDLEFIRRKVELECVLVFLSSVYAYQRLLQQKTSLCFPQVSCCGYCRGIFVIVSYLYLGISSNFG
jgi:hypothetical protein